MSTLAQVVSISSATPVPQGLAEIYRQYHGNVFRAAYQITGNTADAEDVLQTVFLRLWRKQTDAAGVDNLRSYLYRAAVNAALDLVRSQRQEQATSIDDAPEPSTPANDEAVVLRSWLRSALAKLNPRHAEMFALRYLQELENNEIAKLMNTSQAVVAITLFRIRKQLQKDFQAQVRTGK